MNNREEGTGARTLGEIAGKDLERYFGLHHALLKFSELFDCEEDSDRSIATVGAAFLDTVLKHIKHILFAFLIDDEKKVQELLGPDRLLGTYAAKTRMLYCLGLLPRSIRDDLRLIGKNRTRYAHDLSVSFEDDPIRSWHLALKWHRHEMFHEPPSDATVRDHFQVGVNQLASHLHGVVSIACGQAREKRVPDWEKT